MGLLTTANANNRKIDEGLTVSYSTNRVFGHFECTTPPSPYANWYSEAWEYHRYARQSYRYIGLSLEAAETIAQQKIDNYRRTQYISEWNSSDGNFRDILYGEYAGALVNIIQTQGHMYEVQIIVNEHDSRIRLEPHWSGTTLFATENARQYTY